MQKKGLTNGKSISERHNVMRYCMQNVHSKTNIQPVYSSVQSSVSLRWHCQCDKFSFCRGDLCQIFTIFVLLVICKLCSYQSQLLLVGKPRLSRMIQICCKVFCMHQCALCSTVTQCLDIGIIFEIVLRAVAHLMLSLCAEVRKKHTAASV